VLVLGHAGELQYIVVVGGASQNVSESMEMANELSVGAFWPSHT
jgi:hypothetical protein